MPYPLLVSYLDELADRPDDHDDSPPDGSRYQSLKHEAVRDSTRALQHRIRSRFPDRGLWEVCGELAALVDEVGSEGGISRRRIRFARFMSRLLVALIVVFVTLTIALAAADIWADPEAISPIDFLPLLETVINNAVFAGLAVFFLIAVPERMERARVMRLLHRLRSLAHVIDMHQLTKVPERLERVRQRGAETIDIDEVDDLAAEVRDRTSGRGADSVIDAVGMEAHGNPVAEKVIQSVGLLPDAAARKLMTTVGIDRLAAQPPGHLPDIFVLAPEQPHIRPAELQPDADRLALPDDDVRVHLARRAERTERDRLGNDRDQQRLVLVALGGECRHVGDPAEDVGRQQQHRPGQARSRQ